MVRTIIYAIMMFITVFVGGSLIVRGFPVHSPVPGESNQLPILATSFGDNSAEKHRKLLVEAQLQDPENAKRNPLRADALQAATGFALSPCDQTMKANLVAAMQAYAAADREIRKCNPMFTNCDPAFDKATALYSTPNDLRVREALHQAFEKGGISAEDFPPELRMSVMTLANSQGSPVSACDPSRGRRSR